MILKVIYRHMDCEMFQCEKYELVGNKLNIYVKGSDYVLSIDVELIKYIQIFNYVETKEFIKKENGDESVG